MERQKTALVTGVTGQDGWYLARSLSQHGYAVVGSTHRSASEAANELAGLEMELIELDLSSMSQIESLVRERRFDDIYNLAARASSAQLFDDILATTDVNGVAVARLLESVRRHSPQTRVCQASSSEVFAGGIGGVLDESTPRIVRNAYGASKAFADHLVNAYRETWGLYACSAILFSHESPRRPVHFVVRKVANAAATVAVGEARTITINNIESVRDWGYAPDYVDAMRRMMELTDPRDFVIATGQAHTVGELCEVAFGHVGLDWRDYVEISRDPGRPAEPEARIGDSSLARQQLDWAPTVDFEALVTMIVDHDMARYEQPH
jgi:GDPmannose 4,6-dehydratase